ncbi:MAG: PEP-CTERM sorting domain-containing protein [Pseudomonadota bacterium]
MKLKLIALAAMLAAGSAHAAIDSGLLNLDPNTTGNGELMLNLKWKDTNLADGNQSVSATFDLGITMNDAVANFNTPGYSRSWNLNSYGSAFANFLNAVGSNIGNAEMNVIAFDGTGTDPGDTRLLSTTAGINATGTTLSLAASSIPTNGNYNAIFGNVTVVNFMVAVNNSASHNSVANGASNADASSGFALFGDTMDKFGGLSAFDSTNKFDGSYAAGTGVLSGQAKALPFYLVTASDNDPFHKASMTPFGFDVDGDGVIEFDNNGATAGGTSEYGLWTLQGGTLTYSVAAVPEAETYAMMLAGLGLVGFMVRRRRHAI